MTFSIGTFDAGAEISFTFQATTECSSVPSFALIAGAFAPGASLDSGGLLSGSSSVIGTYYFTLAALNAFGQTLADFSITIATPSPANSIGLEDGSGAIELEDGSGTIGLE